MTEAKLIEVARTATAETAIVDFKASFDPAERGDWCELIKDIVAMANSGGGCIVIGCDSNGQRTPWVPDKLRTLDPAHVADQLNKYVEGCHDIATIRWVHRGPDEVPVFIIGDIGIPRVFVNLGGYESPPGRAKQAFPKGAMYFRHGAKSEPAEQSDLAYSIERCIEQVREKWLGNIRRVMEAPAGARVEIVSADVRATSTADASPVRIVNDASVPAIRLLNPDDTHPHRQKDVVALLNDRLKQKAVTSFDIQCLRKVLERERDRPEFFFHSKFGAKQYSDHFIDFVVQTYQDDPLYFTKVRDMVRATRL